ncbi:MAG: hypothetical protein H0T18_08255, partial [Chloroflexia bacterium]|nr:hypothetical protein [Chloroflexia bacterium]
IELIQQLTEGGADQRLFRFQDAALGSDIRAAVSELERLETAGEEPAMILNQLLGQIELAAVAATAAGMAADHVSKDLGVVTAARMATAMSASRKQVLPAKALVSDGLTVDRDLKTGRLRQPTDALLDLVLLLASDAKT